jgi:hypothetical protein
MKYGVEATEFNRVWIAHIYGVKTEILVTAPLTATAGAREKNPGLRRIDFWLSGAIKVQKASANELAVIKQ